MDMFKEGNVTHSCYVGSEIHTSFQDTVIRLEKTGSQINQNDTATRTDDISTSGRRRPEENDTNVHATSSARDEPSMQENYREREVKSYQRKVTKTSREENPKNDSLRDREYLKKNVPYFSEDLLKSNPSDHLFVTDSAFFNFSPVQGPVFITGKDTNPIDIPYPLGSGDNMNLGRSDWILGIILLVLVSFTWARIFYEKYFTQKIQAVYNTQIFGRLRKDRNSFLQRVTIVLVFSYVIIAGLFIYQVFSIFGFTFFGIKGFTLYLILCLIVCGIYILKYIFTFLVGYIFDKRQQFGEYLQIFVIINENIGMFLLPVVAIIPFVEEDARIVLIYIGIAIVAFFYIIRYYRYIKIIASRDVFIFYVFLYFCAFEILPLLLFYKTIKNYII